MRQAVGPYEIDAYTRQEAKEDLNSIFAHHLDRMIQEQVRGIKLIRLPAVVAQASTTTLLLGASGGQETVYCGPQQGYIWRIGRVTISSSGADTGAVSLFQGSDATSTSSQFLVDNTLKVGAAYYPGTRGLFLFPGEQLYANLTSVSGNVYRLMGLATEVPSEMVGKILGN